MPTKEMKGWEITLYNPKLVDKPKEEWEVIYTSKFKNLREATAKVDEVLKEYDMHISYFVMRKIVGGTYASPSSKLAKCINAKKTKLQVNIKIKYETKREVEIL